MTTIDFGLKGNAGAAPDAAVFAFGSLWIPLYASPHGWLVRIDLGARRVIARIPIGESPGSIAIAGGDVWVANTSGDGSRQYAGQNTLSRIDPASNRVVQRVPVEIGGPIAGGFGAVWVPDFWSQGNGTLRKVDARSGRVVAALLLSGRPAVGCGHLWTIDLLLGINVPPVTVVSVIDPRTGNRTAQWPVIAPGIEDPRDVDGDCLTAYGSQDNPAMTTVGQVDAEQGLVLTWPPIGSRVRLADGGFWAVRDDLTYQPVGRDGRVLGDPIALPSAEQGDGWFTVVSGNGWVITNRALFGIGSVQTGTAP